MAVDKALEPVATKGRDLGYPTIQHKHTHSGSCVAVLPIGQSAAAHRRSLVPVS